MQKNRNSKKTEQINDSINKEILNLMREKNELKKDIYAYVACLRTIHAVAFCWVIDHLSDCDEDHPMVSILNIINELLNIEENYNTD